MVLVAMASFVGDLDEALFRALNAAGTNAAMDALMIVITTLGAAFIIVLFAVPLWGRGYREATFDFLLLLGITGGLPEGIQFLGGRPRPCNEVLTNVPTLLGYGGDAVVGPRLPRRRARRAVASAAI